MIYSIDEIKDRLYPIALKYNIPAVYLFGYYAKGSAHENSDFDLLVDTAGSDIKTLIHLNALYDDLSTILEKQIDLVTEYIRDNHQTAEQSVVFYFFGVDINQCFINRKKSLRQR